MRDIWASSPSDVYVVGHNERGFGKMFHFDGKKWKPVGLNPIEGGTIAGPIDLTAIYGFSRDNIFAVGRHIFDNPHPRNSLDSTLIIHFDGQQWREQPIQKNRGLWSVSGVDPNTIWTCGYNGTLYRYDSGIWRTDSVSITIPANGEYVLWDIKPKNLDEAYMLGVVYQHGIIRTTQYFFARKANQWSLVDSFYVEPGRTQVKFGQNGLWVSPQGTLYSFGPHIFRWDGTSWTKLYDIFDFLRRLTGTSDNNIFAVGDFGNILHYNGVNWYQYKELKNTNVVYSSVWTDGKEVFVVGYFNDGSKTLILHGK